MKFNLVSLVIIGLVTLAASGCGDKGPGNPAAYQDGAAGTGGQCSQQIVDDINALDTEGNQASTIEQAQLLKKHAQAFRAKYEGVQCVADLGGKKTTLDVNAKMDEYIAKIDQYVAAHGHPAANPGGNGGFPGAAADIDAAIDLGQSFDGFVTRL